MPVTAAGSVIPESRAFPGTRACLTTTLHLVCDGRGRPLSVVLTPGQRHDRPRYAKRAVNYRAMVVVASLMIWLGR